MIVGGRVGLALFLPAITRTATPFAGRRQGTNMINLAIESAVDEERLDARIAALQQAKVAIARSNGPVDVIAMLTEDAARAEEALDRTAADHKTVKQIRTELFDATDNDAFAPADGDDDLRVMRGPVNTICPISQQVMEDPVKGSVAWMGCLDWCFGSWIVESEAVWVQRSGRWRNVGKSSHQSRYHVFNGNPFRTRSFPTPAAAARDTGRAVTRCARYRSSRC